MRILLTALFSMLMFGAAAAAEPQAVNMSEPRGFGYFVGDTLTRTAEIAVSQGDQFSSASLPAPGQLAYWLELRNVETGETTRGGVRHLTLRLTYQVLYVPIDTRRLVIPASNVEVTGGGGNRIVTVPAFTLLVSPIREIYPEKSGETTATFLKDDAEAQRLPTARARTATLMSTLAATLALVLLAHHRAWWPFHSRAARPFTEAARTVANHRQTYAAALIALHRAFDRAQGERLLASDVDRFFVLRPEQTAARGDVERFFAASRTFFFVGDAVAAETALPRSALERLAHDLAANERTA